MTLNIKLYIIWIWS